MFKKGKLNLKSMFGFGKRTDKAAATVKTAEPPAPAEPVSADANRKAKPSLIRFRRIEIVIPIPIPKFKFIAKVHKPGWILQSIRDQPFGFVLFILTASILVMWAMGTYL